MGDLGGMGGIGSMGTVTPWGWCMPSNTIRAGLFKDPCQIPRTTDVGFDGRTPDHGHATSYSGQAVAR